MQKRSEFMGLNDRTISIRTRRLAKADKVRIMKTKGIYYIEAIPKDYYDNLTATELNQMYISFIKLGRELYNDNKNKNISKIEIVNGYVNLTVDNSLLRNNPCNYIDNNKLELIKHKFNHLLGTTNSFNFSNHNYILLQSNHLKSNNEKLKTWLLDNYIPIMEMSNQKDKEKGKYWFQSDDGMLIDMAIFCYLVTYAIVNTKRKYIGKKVLKDDPILFPDFINYTEDYDDELCICLVNDIIYLYEMSHMYSLYGYNKLVYDYETGKNSMVRQYETIYGVLWHIFKLYLSENYDIRDNEDKHLSISICNDCGIPFIGNSSRCGDCTYYNQNDRQKKLRQEKLEHIDKIVTLINDKQKKKKIPRELLTLANKYTTMNKAERIHSSKKEVDNLLNDLLIYINEGK